MVQFRCLKKSGAIFFVVPVLILILFFLASFQKFVVPVEADDLDTTVTVGNTAPSFSVSPAENPASTSSSPTDVSTNVTFQATATDSNSDDYYLALCKSDSVTPVNGDAPTCPGGNWCISTATSSGVQASCNYNAQASDDEDEIWYAFVCDGDSSAAACSTSQQGTGDSGSPFYVNHQSTFTALNDDGPKDPGATLTFSATGDDPDTNPSDDTIMLVVCKTSGVTGVDCDGGASDRWCRSDADGNPPYPDTSNPDCTYSIPSVQEDGSYNYYGYIFDNHGLQASSTQSGSFTVNNVAPVVSSVTLNSGSDMTLQNADSTTDFDLTATVSDNNSCQDINNVKGYLYRSGIAYSGCDTVGEADNNNCYPEVSCTVVSSGNTCDSSSDGSADYECTVSVQYHADPTDSNTEYPTENWLDTLKATDNSSSTHNAEVAAGVNMLSFLAYDVQESAIAYGSLGIGEISDSTTLPKSTTLEATGNVGLDEELSGDDMCTDYPTCSGDTIAVGQQKYGLTAVQYSSGTALTGSATEAEANCAKTTSTGSNATDLSYWGLQIPDPTPSGSYTGSNTITGVKGESGDW